MRAVASSVPSQEIHPPESDDNSESSQDRSAFFVLQSFDENEDSNDEPLDSLSLALSVLAHLENDESHLDDVGSLGDEDLSIQVHEQSDGGDEGFGMGDELGALGLAALELGGGDDSVFEEFVGVDFGEEPANSELFDGEELWESAEAETIGIADYHVPPRAAQPWVLDATLGLTHPVQAFASEAGATWIVLKTGEIWRFHKNSLELVLTWDSQLASDAHTAVKSSRDPLAIWVATRTLVSELGPDVRRLPKLSCTSVIAKIIEVDQRPVVLMDDGHLWVASPRLDAWEPLNVSDVQYASVSGGLVHLGGRNQHGVFWGMGSSAEDAYASRQVLDANALIVGGAQLENVYILALNNGRLLRTDNGGKTWGTRAVGCAFSSVCSVPDGWGGVVGAVQLVSEQRTVLVSCPQAGPDRLVAEVLLPNGLVDQPDDESMQEGLSLVWDNESEALLVGGAFGLQVWRPPTIVDTT